MGLVRDAKDWVRTRAHAPAVQLHDGGRLPPRLPWTAWALASVSFLGVCVWLFSFVYVRAATMACQLQLDDPLYRFVPLDLRWEAITVSTYALVTGTCVLLMIAQAALGDERPIVRLGVGLAIVGLIRGLCIYLVPLCHVGAEPGTATLATTPRLDLGFTSIPWRMWATNDVLLSGHVGELILLLRLTRSWPRPARAFLWLFSGLQIFGLLSTRADYTVGIIVAFPCAYFADRMAVKLLAALSRG